ncbi:MAG: helicase-associated domain-containing protein [Candidatus Promineifilaceae bacterium]
MYSLKQSLLEHHLIVLRVLGEWLELELIGMDKLSCAEALADVLRRVNFQQELNYLQPEEADAVRELAAAGGKMPVSTFGRKYGVVRQMGPGRLEREKPWFNPDSAAEALWYRGFLFSGFDETSDGLVEYYYIPEELFVKLDVPLAVKEESAEISPTEATEDVAPFRPIEPEDFAPGATYAVDDLTTLLALAQRGVVENDSIESILPYLINRHVARLTLLFKLAEELNMLRPNEDKLRPTRHAVTWLQESRENQLRALANAWQRSVWNALRQMPALICEGNNWQNDPIRVRLALRNNIPSDGSWIRVADLIAAIKSDTPDFLRPDGNYDSWYIRDAESNEYLNGFESWDAVEGQLLAYVIHQPLAWLGLVDYSADAVRWTARGVAWIEDRRLQVEEPDLPLTVQPDAQVIVPRQASRHQRFQLARIAIPQPYQQDRPYMFAITPASLEFAKTQGIQPQRVLTFLQNAMEGAALPAGTKRAIERWGEHGTEGRFESVMVLRVADTKVITTLRRNPKTCDLLGESLNDRTVIVDRDNWDKLQSITTQLGLLLESPND